MTPQTKIKLITATAAVLDTVLIYGDKVADIPGIPGWLAHAWPAIMALTIAFDRVAHIFLGDAPAVVTPVVVTPPVTIDPAKQAITPVGAQTLAGFTKPTQ